MSLVQTTKGLVDKTLLEVRDIITNEDNARILATEWFLDGELVRRDVNVNILNGIDLFSEKENI